MLEFYRPYRVAAANIWPYDSALETWGTYLALRNLSSFTATPQVDTDTMMVYGAIEHVLSVNTGFDLECMFGGLQQDAIDLITGRTRQESGAGDTEVWRGTSQDGDNKPYFAMAVQLSVDAGGGDVHVYFPRVKLFGDMPVELSENNAFVKPQVTFKAARLRMENQTLYDSYIWKRYAVVTTLPTVFATAIAAIE